MPDEVKDDAGKVKDQASQDQSGGGEKKPEDPPKWVNDLFTRIGRVDAETKKRFEALESKLTARQEERHPASNGNAEMDAENQKLTERLLQGDPVSVVSEIVDKRERAKEMLAQRNQEKLNTLMDRLEDAPLFKDVKDKVREVATEFVFRRGYSVEDALGYAYEKAKADHLMKIHLGGNGSPGFDSASLETSGGGTRRQDAGEKKGKLNSDGKAAFEKNKNVMIDGKLAFPDEATFISSMSPLVKQRFVG